MWVGSMLRLSDMESGSMLYKKWRRATDPKKEGVTGLVICGLLDGLTDGFGRSDGFRTGWMNPSYLFPTTI
jgi:hypothetical protein